MGQTSFITCNNCHLEFHAEENVDGECPDCGNEYSWDSIPDGVSTKMILMWDFDPEEQDEFINKNYQ